MGLGSVYATSAETRATAMDSKLDITGVTAALYNLLKPLDAGDRKRVVQAAQTLLGEVDDVTAKNSSRPEEPVVDRGAHTGTHSKARIWLQKNGLSDEIISQVFHIEGETAEIIAAEVPGKSGREKAINAYLLTGARNFLVTGDAKFDDKSARESCKALGCYSDTNHATYIKDKGNLISGSKVSGWMLTAPGQKEVADLIKEIASS